MNEEHQMYLSHLRLPQGDPPQLMPNMVHSLTQQVMRQDPLYLYQVSLRPDHAWRFIFIPFSDLSMPRPLHNQTVIESKSTCQRFCPPVNKETMKIRGMVTRNGYDG